MHHPKVARLGLMWLIPRPNRQGFAPSMSIVALAVREVRRMNSPFILLFRLNEVAEFCSSMCMAATVSQSVAS
jgi:hypothetical protein